MFSKFFSCAFAAVLVLLIPLTSYGQGGSLILFADDFESYAPGLRLACMDTIHGNVHWDTWSRIPCDPVEDPIVTSTNSYSGTNSVWIQQNNDLVKPIPDFTAGRFSIRFRMFIPANFTASWGQLACFVTPSSTEWAFLAKFDPQGNGYAKGGGRGAPFPFSYNTWMHNELIVDLGNDSAEYYFEGALVHKWQWSLGLSGDTCALQLSKTDIMGSDWPLPDPSQWYLDDFIVERLDTVLSVNDFIMPAEFTLEQNYPNPFNPTTIIQYQIPNTRYITLKVFDLLGREVATLVNEVKEPGEYSVLFDASALASGVYLYRLFAIGETSSRGDGQAGSSVETKKLVVLR